MAAEQHTDAPAAGAIIEAHTSHTGVVTTMAKPSMSMAMASSSVVPKMTPFLKVNEFGILVGKNDKMFKHEIKAKILLVEDRGFALKWTLRYGNPAQYLSTYDGQVCDKGGSWNDAIRKVMSIDPRAAEPYISADIVVTVTETFDVTGGKIEAGTKLAINLSKTNFSEWQEFFAAANEAGVVGQEVDVIIGDRSISHNGNNWGVVTFTLA